MLKESVPELANYSMLKANFEWLIDGNISDLVHKNLGPELDNLELFLR